MVNYVAFLRGINVGGNKSIPMQELKEVFESLGFKNVRTLLASGNVIFEAMPISANSLKQKIGEKLEKYFGHSIGVIIRTIDELQHMREFQGFKGTKVTPETRLYVTFLPEKTKGNPKLPIAPKDKSFKILRVTESEVFSVLTLSLNSGTIDLMNVLEKEFGRNITTRNWNTIVRILTTQKSH